MSLSWEKIVVAIGLAVASAVLGLLPWVTIRRKGSPSAKFNLFLSLLSSFGGGVLLSTSILHMLPHLRERVIRVESLWTSVDEHFPLAEVFVLTGLILIYFIEEAAHYIMGDDGKHHGHSHHETVARHNTMAHNIPVPDCSHHEAFNKEECPQEKNRGQIVRGALALFALSFHGVLEGIAVGVQEKSNVWFLFGAVASHEFLISFCMGLELALARVKALVFVSSVLFFSLISSIGIIIGAAMTSASSTDTPTIAIIEGIAAGTLLYVVFFEIMSRERERKEKELKEWQSAGFLQFIALTLGLVIMAVLITTVGNSHDHAHGPQECQDDHGDHDSHEH